MVHDLPGRVEKVIFHCEFTVRCKHLTLWDLQLSPADLTPMQLSAALEFAMEAPQLVVVVLCCRCTTCSKLHISLCYITTVGCDVALPLQTFGLQKKIKYSSFGLWLQMVHQFSSRTPLVSCGLQQVYSWWTTRSMLLICHKLCPAATQQMRWCCLFKMLCV